jgi:hypothetical protein
MTTFTSTRQKGWVWREGRPVEIEYESGFSTIDGFPFCHEIGTWIPLSPVPASSRREVIEAQKAYIRNTIEQYRQAIEAMTGKLRQIDKMDTVLL